MSPGSLACYTLYKMPFLFVPSSKTSASGLLPRVAVIQPAQVGVWGPQLSCVPAGSQPARYLFSPVEWVLLDGPAAQADAALADGSLEQACILWGQYLQHEIESVDFSNEFLKRRLPARAG